MFNHSRDTDRPMRFWSLQPHFAQPDVMLICFSLYTINTHRFIVFFVLRWRYNWQLT